MFSRALHLNLRTAFFHNHPNLNQLSAASAIKTPLTLQQTSHSKDQKRHYKNFGHKPDKVALFTKIWYSAIFAGLLFSVVDYRWYVEPITVTIATR